MVPAFSLGGFGSLLGGGFGIGPGLGDPSPGTTTTQTDTSGSSQGTGTQSWSGPLTVTATSPADGSVTTASPSSFSITFDRPINSLWLFRDFSIRTVGADGTTLNSIQIGEETVDPIDPSQIDVSLAAPLQPGQYQIVLLGFNGVQGVDGSTVNTMGQDDVLTSFAIAKPGATVADAQYLGVVGPKVQTVTGSLDLASDPSSVAIYSFVVPSGSTWRLGAEVQAQRIGSPIDTVLSLFDANGHVIATDDIGRPGFSLDPYLFQVLHGGLYYLGVSSTGNVPGTPGGYDLANGFAGTNAWPQPSGVFQLQVVADPMTGPTTVSSFQIHAADPASSQPTGFSIGFSARSRSRLRTRPRWPMPRIRTWFSSIRTAAHGPSKPWITASPPPP